MVFKERAGGNTDVGLQLSYSLCPGYLFQVQKQLFGYALPGEVWGHKHHVYVPCCADIAEPHRLAIAHRHKGVAGLSRYIPLVDISLLRASPSLNLFRGVVLRRRLGYGRKEEGQRGWGIGSLVGANMHPLIQTWAAPITTCLEVWPVGMCGDLEFHA